MTTTTTSFHVYAEDGFVSAHRTEDAARRVAQRGASRRGGELRVYRAGPDGTTSATSGTLVASYRARPVHAVHCSRRADGAVVGGAWVRGTAIDAADAKRAVRAAGYSVVSKGGLVTTGEIDGRDCWTVTVWVD